MDQLTKVKPNEYMEMTFGPGAYLVGLDQTIEWLAPIESVPTIIVYYRNFTLVNGIRTQFTASQAYPAKSVHIEPYSTIDSEKSGWRNTAIDTIIVALAIAELGPYAIPKRQKPETKSTSGKVKSKKHEDTKDKV